MSIQDQQRKELIKLFNEIAPYHRRERVFCDFVNLSAIAIHNQRAFFNNDLEKQYLDVISAYEKADVEKLCNLLGAFVICLVNNPKDLLGSIYMELDIGCSGLGQFFSPSCIHALLSQLMSRDIKKELDQKEFILLAEPSAGSSGMVISFAEEIKLLGYKPEEKLFAYCIDIDRTAVYMSYLQLSILNIPAIIYHGNTLTMEMYGSLCTPAYYKYSWDKKLTKKSVAKNIIRSPLEQMSLGLIA